MTKKSLAILMLGSAGIGGLLTLAVAGHGQSRASQAVAPSAVDAASFPPATRPAESAPLAIRFASYESGPSFDMPIGPSKTTYGYWTRRRTAAGQVAGFEIIVTKDKVGTGWVLSRSDVVSMLAGLDKMKAAPLPPAGHEVLVDVYRPDGRPAPEYRQLGGQAFGGNYMGLRPGGPLMPADLTDWAELFRRALVDLDRLAATPVIFPH